MGHHSVTDPRLGNPAGRRQPRRGGGVPTPEAVVMFRKVCMSTRENLDPQGAMATPPGSANVIFNTNVVLGATPSIITYGLTSEI